jgi:manganese transport protein
MVMGFLLFWNDFCTTWHGDVLYGLIPSMPNETALYIAIGIIGGYFIFFFGANQKIW